MEDLASIPLNQQVIIQKETSINSKSPPTKPQKISAPPIPKMNFKGSLESLEMLVEVKTKLLNKRQWAKDEEGRLIIDEEGKYVITDLPHLNEHEQKQFTAEIKTIQSKINQLKGLKEDLVLIKGD
jgi:hypothetical protein